MVVKTDPNVVKAILAIGQLNDDRSVAVAAGAIVKQTLSTAILGRLRELDRDDQNSLLDNSGHGDLASFSQKIWIGFA